MPPRAWGIADGGTTADGELTVQVEDVPLTAENPLIVLFSPNEIVFERTRFTGPGTNITFGGTAAAGRVLAKTGYIENVYSLSGYLTTLEGDDYAFSVFVNQTAGEVQESGLVVDAHEGALHRDGAHRARARSRARRPPPRVRARRRSCGPAPAP